MRFQPLITIVTVLIIASAVTSCMPEEPVEPAEGSSSSSVQSLRSSSLSNLSSASSAASVVASVETEVPDEKYLDVPFASQAPLGDWSDPFQQEGCEEMSAIMVHHFLEGTGLTPEQALADLRALSDFETSKGFGLDVNIDELASVVEEFYGHDARVVTDVTVENIKREIAAGNPVIVPAAGRQLGNPYFSGEGPWYHMLVITGYDDDTFTTNDPGTRRGEEYRYDHDTLLNAIHDWTGVKEDTGNGRKVMLVLES